MRGNDSSCCRKVSTFLGSVMLAGIAFALMLAVPRTGNAQVLYGSVVGHVADPSGAAVPGAKVTLTNQGTNISTSTTTNSGGDYTFSTIVAGTYTLEITQTGFQAYRRTDVPVTINTVARADVALTIGAVTQTVEVTGERPLLQTDTSEVHANIDAPALSNLPVPLGRNYQQLYRAQPGFSPPSNSHSYPTNPARALAFNVNGVSSSQNNTQIDGVSTYNVQLPHVNSYVPTLDSIQQVNVVTDSFDAEEGFAGGAAINVETKSGTNQLHGDIFEYHNNNHLKSWPMLFDNAGRNAGNSPKYIYNDFGGSAGGPIVKNKLFWFASYEGLFNNFTAQTTTSVLTPEMRAGDLSATGTDIYDPLTGNPDGTGRTVIYSTNIQGDPTYNPLCSSAQCNNMIPTSRLNSISQHILTFVPDPNLGGDQDNYFVSGVRVFHRNQVDSKINYNVNSKLNLIGTFGFLHYINDTPTAFGTAGGGPDFGSGANPGKGDGNSYRVTIMGTYTFSPNFLVDAHFGWGRQGTNSVQRDLGSNIGSDVLGIPGTNGTRNFESGWPEFDMTDSFDTIGQVDNFMPYYRKDPQKQYVANFSWLKGPHNVRFGFNLYSQALNQTQAEDLSGGYGAQGGFNFGQAITGCADCGPQDPVTLNPTASDTSEYNGAATFLLGLPTNFGRNYQVPDVFHVRANLYSLYVRDRWNITKKLTADYGVRWEYYPIPTRPDRGIEVYDPANNTINLCGFGSVPSGCGVEISKKLFSPRVGFAYRITDTFVVRAGYGMTTDPYIAIETMRNNFPVSIASHINNIGPGGDFVPVCLAYDDPVNPTGCDTPYNYTYLENGIPALTAPDLGNGILPFDGSVSYGGYPTKKFQRGYVQSWNLTIQKELGKGFTGQVGYVATRQTKMLGFKDINAGQILGGGTAGEPLFAAWGRSAPTINIVPVGSGHYDSLQAVLNRRFTGGLLLQVNYTYSHSIGSNDNSDGGPNILVERLMYLNQATNGFDRTHSLQIMHVWELPFGKGKRWLSSGGVGSFIAGGWQLSGLASFITGTPFTVWSNENNWNTPGSGQTADQVLSNVAKLGGVGIRQPYYDTAAYANPNAPRLGTSGFNKLRGPGIGNYDFSVSRDFNLNEQFRLQFRMDSFNFTNTPHLSNPRNTVGSSSFMTIHGVSSLAREGIDERQFEFGLKLFF